MHAVTALGRISGSPLAVEDAPIHASLPAAARPTSGNPRNTQPNPLNFQGRVVRALGALGACLPITQSTCESQSPPGVFQSDGSCVFPDGSRVDANNPLFDGDLSTGACGNTANCPSPSMFVTGSGPQWPKTPGIPGICVPPGGKTYPDGSVLGQDGTTTFADGSTLEADGTFTTAHGSVVAPDGTVSNLSVLDQISALPSTVNHAVSDLSQNLESGAKQALSTVQILAIAAVAVAAAYVVSTVSPMVPARRRRRA